MYDKFYCSLHTYMADESGTFNLKLGCTNELFSAYCMPYIDGYAEVESIKRLTWVNDVRIH